MLYTVKSGDTLFKISEMFYGSGNHYNDIAAVNGIQNVNLIHVGQQLTIPGTAKMGPLAPGEAPMNPPVMGPTLPTSGTVSNISPPSGGTVMKWALIAGAGVLGFLIIKTLMDRTKAQEA
jgi:LysM repeat protein